jgi:hypothetical protein
LAAASYLGTSPPVFSAHSCPSLSAKRCHSTAFWSTVQATCRLVLAAFCWPHMKMETDAAARGPVWVVRREKFTIMCGYSQNSYRYLTASLPTYTWTYHSHPVATS